MANGQIQCKWSCQRLTRGSLKIISIFPVNGHTYMYVIVFPNVNQRDEQVINKDLLQLLLW